MSRRRSWCFTSFHVEEEDIEKLKQNLANAKYYIFQKEKGNKKEHPHLQGYVTFKTGRSFSKVKEIMGLNDVHLEVAKGSAKDNIAYCSKSDGRLGGPWEYGKKPAQGYRTDLVDFKDKIKENVRKRQIDMVDLVDEFPCEMVKYYKFAEWYTKEMLLKEGMKLPFEPKQVYVLWGEAGAGKTKLANTTFLDYECYSLNIERDRSLWFDGYVGQPVVIIDEFEGPKQIDLTYLLRLLDGYPMRVQTKGGFTCWCPSIVVITSNYRSSEWYTNESPYRLLALERRITKELMVEKGKQTVLEFKNIKKELFIDCKEEEKLPENMVISNKELEEKLLEIPFLDGQDEFDIEKDGWDDNLNNFDFF